MDDEALENLSWNEKCRLIQSDPVTCARHFDYMVQRYMHDFLGSENSPLGKLKESYYTAEMQHRGSPHIHLLLWIEDAPVYGIDSNESVIDFIDSVITCSKPGEDSTLFPFVSRQLHKHSRTCKKGNRLK